MSLALEDIERCLHGIIPSVVATADTSGMPNVSYVSHVELVDTRHLALSCQFFNKTRRNVEANPRASLWVNDPLDFTAFRLRLRFVRSETEGPLYERMTTRIEAIATHTGMVGVFRLLSADVFEVEDIQQVEGFLDPAQGQVAPLEGPDPAGPLTELRGLQAISSRINAAVTLEGLVDEALAALAESLGFDHSMLLVVDETGQRLTALSSHGYGRGGVGAEVALGSGLIGRAAEERRILRTVGMEAELRYARAVRERATALGQLPSRAEVPLPGLPDAQSQMALPLCVGQRLIGVLAVESAHPLRFEQWHEAFLQLVGNQLALALDRFGTSDDREDSEPAPPSSALAEGPKVEAVRVSYYPADDCVFLGDEYLVRGLPGRILWKLLCEMEATGRREFTNRELRLDRALGLPAIKDNLESRLLLLRRRLDEKCPACLALRPVRRGRFELCVGGPLVLEQNDA